MMHRPALLAAIVALVLVVLFAPSAAALITGRPLSVDCGGLEPAACDEAWREEADGWPHGVGIGPVTWVAIEPINGTCGSYTFGHWWPAFDPLAMRSDPLC